MRAGYLRFIIAAGVGAAVTTLLVFLFTTKLGLYYLFARLITSGLVGMGNYFFNLYINFKVAGKHH